MGVNISSLFIFLHSFFSFFFHQETPLRILLWNGVVDLAKINRSNKGRRSKDENVQIRYISDEKLPPSVLFISNQIFAYGETMSFKTFVQPSLEKEDQQLKDNSEKNVSDKSFFDKGPVKERIGKTDKAEMEMDTEDTIIGKKVERKTVKNDEFSKTRETKKRIKKSRGKRNLEQTEKTLPSRTGNKKIKRNGKDELEEEKK